MSYAFNHEMLLLARQYRGANQSDVAEGAGLDQGHYSRIERGLFSVPPSEETIRPIAEVLDFPVSFFYQGDEISGLPLSVHDAAWRKRASTSATDLKRLHAELNLRIMHIRRYLDAVAVDAERPLPHIDVDEIGGADKVATYIRRAWLIPDGPINNLTAFCERAGILVVQCDFVEKVDGVTMQLRGLPPLIFLNRNSPPDRMRHSLAHELGHLIMHSIPTDTMEEEADRFAGELLAPFSQLRVDLIGGKITLERLVQLKKYWKVSVASLLYRAEHGGLLNRNQASYLWRQISARGWRKREPDETQFTPEVARLYEQIIALHENELGYSAEEFGKMLHLSMRDLASLYSIFPEGVAHGHLRIVK